MTKLMLLDPMAKVFPDGVSGFETAKGSMLSNERYHFSFCVLRDENTPLIGVVKVESDISEYVRIFRAENVPAVAVNGAKKDDYLLRGKSGLYPDPLVSCNGHQVFAAHAYTGYAAEVYCKNGLPAGEHFITVCVTDRFGEELCRERFQLTVKEARLPENDLMITQWIHYDCIAKTHGVAPFSEEYYAVLKNYFETAVNYGQTMILTPLFTFALDTDVGGERETFQLVTVKRQNGEYAFDFSKLKKFIEFALSCGFTYLEFSHLFTQWGAKACPKIMAEENGKTVRIFGWENASDGEEYAQFLACFLPELSRFLQEMGVQDRCYFHLSDEPKQDALPLYRRLSATVRKHFPNVRVIDALSDYDFYGEGLVDLPAVATNRAVTFYENRVPCLAYHCGAQSFDYLSNRFLDMPLQRTRVLGFQLYETGAKGFLHWGFNFYMSVLSLYDVDPYRVTDAGGYYPAGDAFIVYPEGDGCIPSLRLFGFYDGIQDYLALKLVERRYGREFTQKLLREAGVKGYTEYPHSAAWHLELREKINQLIG